MKPIQLVSALMLSVALGFTACKKQTAADNPSRQGLVTEVGAPIGAAVTRTIGASGGTISSADGRITVTIPAGALAADQSISLQTLINKAPAGVQHAVRLSPSNLSLSQPASVTLTYTDAEIGGTVPEALGLAQQGEDGIWKTVKVTALNKTTKTLTADLVWDQSLAFFQTFHLEPADAVVEVGENVELKVVSTLPDKELLVNISTPAGTPLCEETEFEANYVKRWQLIGDGILGSRQHKALYTAPGQVPTPNPVTVTVTLELASRGQFLLTGRITVVDKEGILITAGAGPASGTVTLTRTPNMMLLNNIGRLQLTAYLEGGNTQHSKHVEIIVPPAVGVYPWSRNGHVSLTYISRTNGHNDVYNTYYSDNIRWYNSTGQVEITRYGNVGEYITGTFVINNSGYGDDNRSTTTVNGWFAVKRTN
jgi:hypothetical protein